MKTIILVINITSIFAASISGTIKDKNTGEPLPYANIVIENSEIGTSLEVNTNKGNFEAIIVEKPFFDPKKKIASN